MTIQTPKDVITFVPVDVVDLEILSIYVDNVLISPTPVVNDYVLKIILPTPLEKGKTAKIKINYRYHTFDQSGFCLFYKDTANSVFENIAYTVNSPEFARF
jgi:hypothetical protein